MYIKQLLLHNTIQSGNGVVRTTYPLTSSGIELKIFVCPYKNQKPHIKGVQQSKT